MKFEVNTVVDRKSMTAMAKAARKTTRWKTCIAVRVFGALAFVAAMVMGMMRFQSGDPHWWIDWALAFGLLLLIQMEDAMNGRSAMRQVTPENAEIATIFTEDGYTNTTSAAEGHWTYDKIQVPCEMKDYFVLLIGKRQGQVYDKDGFVQGSVDEFRSFISEKTGKPVKYIK